MLHKRCALLPHAASVFSATGTGRRRPDVLRKSTVDLAELPTLQLALAKKALTLLCDGGVLVYATCSLLKVEGEEVVAELLRWASDGSFPGNTHVLKFEKGEIPVSVAVGSCSWYISRAPLECCSGSQGLRSIAYPYVWPVQVDLHLGW